MNLFTPIGQIFLLLAIALIVTETAQAQQYWTGDGGKGIRLAVLEPVGKGLSADEQWMVSLVQGSITGDFNKFSAMTIIDRQNLEKIFAEWKESMSGHYSDEDRVKIGNLTNANHILTGSVSKTNNVFILELTVTDLTSGERKASYSPTPVSLLAIENLSAIKTASADLLRQLGVGLTDAAIGALMQTVNTTRMQAETMLARGIAAQKKGTDVAALSYFFQATALDASLIEASKRSSVVAANISSGNIGADVRNDILWRKSWITKLQETEETFYKMINTADLPYTMFYSTNIARGNINYQKETANLSIRMGWMANYTWFNAMERALQAAQTVLNGLNATNRKNDWGLANWPRQGVSNTNPFVTVRKYDIKLVFELVNEQGRVIGSERFTTHHTFQITLNNNGRFTVTFDENSLNLVEFKGVKANDISDNLTIRIASINEAPPQNARFTITTVSNSIEKQQPLIDNRDGKRYNTVKIGYQTWMAENLDYKIGNSRCYDDIEENCNKYGRLYNWNTAKNACPSGWHLPSDDGDWAHLRIMTTDLGRNNWNGLVSFNNAGTNLKSKTDWIKGNNGDLIPGTDIFGFSALPSGGRLTDRRVFPIGNIGAWWTATEKNDSHDAFYWHISYDNGDLLHGTNGSKEFYLSVRCIQDGDPTPKYTLPTNASPSSEGSVSRSPNQTNYTSGTFTDSRDGQTYKTVVIGGKTWMAQNLNYWPRPGKSGCYGNDILNCGKYGRLYDWNTAQTACFTGWHLPTQQEWNDLVTAAGGAVAGRALKSATGGWADNGNGVDSYGFSALPSGYRDIDGSFSHNTDRGYWWTATNGGGNNAYFRSMRSENNIVLEGNLDKNLSFPIRCVKNN